MRDSEHFVRLSMSEADRHSFIVVVFVKSVILCLWFRASLIYINNRPRCNTKQPIYYSASSLYMFWVSTAPHCREYTKL